MEIAAALWLPLALTNKKYRLDNTLITLSILVFTLVIGLADILGVNPYNSFWSNHERMEGYITILHLALYFIVLKSVFRNKRDWKIFFSILLLVSVIAGVFSFVVIFDENNVSYRRHFIEYGGRISGAIGNPTFLASYLLLSIFIGLILFFNSQKKMYQFFCLLVVVLNSAMIYLTGTRGVILAGLTGCFLGLYFVLRKKWPVIKGLSVITMLSLFIVLSIGFFIISNTNLLEHDTTFQRFTNMLSDPSVNARLNTWKMAWHGIKKKPLLGWGQENYISVYSLNSIPYVQERVWLDRAHNIIVHWLINAGILGLLSYFVIFGTTFYVIKKKVKEQKIGKSETMVIVTALIVYVIQNLFTFDTINTYLIFFALLAYIDTVGNGAVEEGFGSKYDTDFKKNMLFISLTVFTLLCFSLVSYFLNYRPIKQSRQIVAMYISAPENDSYFSLLKEYEKILNFKEFGNFSTRVKMIEVSRDILRRRLFEIKGAKEFIQATIKEVDKEILSKMYDMAYLTRVIGFFKEIAVYKSSFISRAESLIQECIRINPEYEWLYIALADVSKLKKDYEGVFNNVKKVVEFDPQNDNKLISLALAAIYSSKEDVLEDSLEKIRDIRQSDGRTTGPSVFSVAELYKFVHVYKEIYNNEKTIEYLKKVVEVLSYGDKFYLRRDYEFHKPVNKAGIHIELANLYLKSNDRENAIKEAKIAQSLAPLRFKDEISRIID